MRPLKLRDNPASPIEAVAIDLLRSIGRYEPPAGAKQRVRLRLFEAPHRGRVTPLRPLLVFAALLVAAGASAAWGQRWFARGALVASANSARTYQHETLSAARWLKAGRVATPVAEVAAIDAPNRNDNVGRAEPTTRVSPASERALVFDAMRALRREGQPIRAAKLLDEYLRSYPKGLLAEEALALAIEAATANGDPRAKSFAERYLNSYPEGRFRSAAMRARSRFSP